MTCIKDLKLLEIFTRLKHNDEDIYIKIRQTNTRNCIGYFSSISGWFCYFEFLSEDEKVESLGFDLKFVRGMELRMLRWSVRDNLNFAMRSRIFNTW